MAPSTFHPFLRLPHELRLIIWEFAIRSSSCTGGVYYFSVISQGDALEEGGLEALVPPDPLHPPAPGSAMLAVPNIGPLVSNPWPPRGRANTSAYFWDVGLWAACWESRNIMTRQFEEHCQYVKSWCTYWDDTSVSESFPTLATAADRGPTRRVTVDPEVDLLHLTFEDWGSEPSWEDIWVHLSFRTVVRGLGPVRNVAVEYEPCWSADMPLSLMHLYIEEGVRGFFIRLLMAAVHERIAAFVWLIDRSTATPDIPPWWELPRQVFSDVGTEYMETDRREMVWEDRPGMYGNAACFVAQLSQYRDWANPFRRPNVNPGWVVDLDEYVGILTCRDV